MILPEKYDMKHKIIKSVLKCLLIMDNFVYSLISKYSVKLERGLHPKHRLTKYHEFFLKNINNSDSVLDIGCGNGYNTSRLAEKAARVTGIDIDADNISVAKQKYHMDNIEYITGDATSYLFNEKFDVIILSNVLEHIEERVGFLRKVKGLGSKILIRVPMLDREWKVLYKKEFGIEYRLDKTHVTEYTFQELVKELRDAGLKIHEYTIRFGEIWAAAR